MLAFLNGTLQAVQDPQTSTNNSIFSQAYRTCSW
jgi:hypothetical protein